jgi:hypothetical protein
MQNGKSIGKAKVIAVREKMSALQITRLKKEHTPNIGDELIYDTSQEEESEDFLLQLETDFFSSEKLTQSTNYYLKGQNSATDEYRSGGALIGGVVAGVLLGLIGWGIGYAIISGAGIDVPNNHLTNLNYQQTHEFRSGYEKAAKKKRNDNYHAGALIGTLVAVVIVLSATDANL